MVIGPCFSARCKSSAANCGWAMSLPPVPDAPQRRDHHFEHSYFEMKNISTQQSAASLPEIM
jgi:hypothetical protein